MGVYMAQVANLSRFSFEIIEAIFPSLPSSPWRPRSHHLRPFRFPFNFLILNYLVISRVFPCKNDLRYMPGRPHKGRP